MDLRRLLTFGIVLTIVGASYAQPIPDERMKKQMERDFALIKQHADAYYPAITRAPRLPGGVVIGLIVNRDLEVLDHSVAFDWAEGVSTTDELRRMFPEKRLAERTGGGGCFGGTKPDEPKYCVVFGELEK